MIVSGFRRAGLRCFKRIVDMLSYPLLLFPLRLLIIVEISDSLTFLYLKIPSYAEFKYFGKSSFEGGFIFPAKLRPMLVKNELNLLAISVLSVICFSLSMK